MQTSVQHNNFLQEDNEPLRKFLVLLAIDVLLIFEGICHGQEDIVEFVIGGFYGCENGHDFGVKFCGEGFRKSLSQIENVNADLIANLTELDEMFEFIFADLVVYF